MGRTFLFLGMLGCNSAGLGGSPEVDSNGMLRLVITIENADPAGTLATVGVHDATTGALVSGAKVRLGSIAELPELMPPYRGVYQSTLPVFAEGWDVAVERGADHVRGLHLVGPSAPSVSVLDSDGIVVRWEPAHQEGVTSQIDLTRLEPPADPYQRPLELAVESSSDEGSAGPFTVPRLGGDAYEVAVTLSRRYDGAWGTASVRVMRRTVLHGQ
jgi:hypothetical protein